MRCFIGAELPDSIKDLATSISKDIDGKRVERENIHITIKFLGEVNDADKIVNKLSFLNEYPSFNVKIHGVGFFPSKDRPRVVWIGVISNDFVDLMKNVDDALYPDFPKERSYVPHITIARVRKPIDTKKFDDIGFLGEVKIEKVTLFRSRLLPTGPVYSKIHTWLLK